MSLIEKNRFWIFIVHVLDMPVKKNNLVDQQFDLFSFPPQYILFGNYAEQSAIVSDKGLSKSQFPEHVHDSLHWSLNIIWFSPS